MPPKKARKPSAPAADLSSLVLGIEEFCTCCKCQQVPREADIVQCTAGTHYMCTNCLDEMVRYNDRNIFFL